MLPLTSKVGLTLAGPRTLYNSLTHWHRFKWTKLWSYRELKAFVRRPPAYETATNRRIITSVTQWQSQRWTTQWTVSPAILYWHELNMLQCFSTDAAYSIVRRDAEVLCVEEGRPSRCCPT